MTEESVTDETLNGESVTAACTCGVRPVDGIRAVGVDPELNRAGVTLLRRTWVPARGLTKRESE